MALRYDAVFAHEHPWNGTPFPNGAVPPRRLRNSMQVDPKAGGKFDLENDPRCHYYYDIDDSASVSAFVSSGRASGWYDKGPNSYTFDWWDMEYFSIKPFYFDGTGANNLMNEQPFLWFQGQNSVIQSQTASCMFQRISQDIVSEGVAKGTSGSGLGSFFIICVHLAYIQHFWTADPTDTDIDSRLAQLTYPHMRISRTWTYNKFDPFDEYCSIAPLSTQPRRGLVEDETAILSFWVNMKPDRPRVVLRVNGCTEHTWAYERSDILSEEIPYAQSTNCFWGAGYRTELDYNDNKACTRWACGAMWLGFGDFTFQEVNYMETVFMNRFGVDRRYS